MFKKIQGVLWYAFLDSPVLRWITLSIVSPIWYFVSYYMLPWFQYFKSMKRDKNIELILSTRGLTTFSECLYLMSIASSTNSGNIVEIGCYQGRSTLSLAFGSKSGYQVPVYAIDPHEDFKGSLGRKFGKDNKSYFIRNISRAGLEDIVHLISLTSLSASQSWTGDINILFIDGDHRYEAVKIDFEKWEIYIVQGGLVVFHDAYEPQLGPSQLISEILSSGRYSIIHRIPHRKILFHHSGGILTLQKL